MQEEMPKIGEEMRAVPEEPKGDEPKIEAKTFEERQMERFAEEMKDWRSKEKERDLERARAAKEREAEEVEEFDASVKKMMVYLSDWKAMGGTGAEGIVTRGYGGRGNSKKRKSCIRLSMAAVPVPERGKKVDPEGKEGARDRALRDDGEGVRG